MADLNAMVSEFRQGKAEFAQRKQAEREALFEQRDESITAITTDPANYRAYLDLQADNPAVSPGNLALVRAQNPEASMVATMDRWNSRGRTIIRGETGIKIIIPQKYRNDRGMMRTGYDVGRVFDVSQTHGARLPPPLALLEGTPEMDKAIRALVFACPVPIETVDNFMDGSFYNPQDRRILIDPDLPDVEQFPALVREIAHARLHGGYQGDYSRDLCATDADSVAYLVCRRFGVETPPPSAKNLDMLYDDLPANERRAALDYLQESSKSLIDRVEQELNPPRERAEKGQEEPTK